MSHPYQGVPTNQLTPTLGQYQDSASQFDLSHPSTHHDASSKELHTANNGLPYGTTPKPRKWWQQKRWLILGAIALLAVIVGAVLGGVLASRNSDKKASTEHTVIQAADGSSGGDGSTVTMDDGTTFIYNNSFGGNWVATPLDFSARCRENVKPLSEPWDYSYDRIHGVNLGGWFVLEPFITPQLFEPYANEAEPVRDEYHLSIRLGSNLSAVLEEHYSTFITERDFANIAAAGLDWIRLPIPYWFIETQEGEPFLEGVGWKYVLKAFEWCRKYGLRMELDIHALPGSQNGQNHSGFVGGINFLAGTMGLVNAERSLSYIRTLAQFIAQPQYAPIASMFHVANEVAMLNIGEIQTKSFYVEAYNLIRNITGIGAGNGPMLPIHNGFVPDNTWYGYMTGADRLALETHYYLAYSPDLFITNLAQDLSRPCVWWQGGNNATLNEFGFQFAGEWSLAINDCGQWINGMPAGSHYGGDFNSTRTTPVGDCGAFMNWRSFTPEFKTQMSQLTQFYMDMSRGSFFWSWKMGANSTGEIPNPLWSYELGWLNDWIPKDPQDSLGTCQSTPAQLSIEAPEAVAWSPPLAAWMTGGSGAGEIPASATANFSVWPPTSLTELPNVANLYTYTATGTPITMSADLPATASANGWANPSDTAGYFVPVAGCDYPNAYSGDSMSAPTAPPCPNGGNAARRLAREIRPTPAPKF